MFCSYHRRRGFNRFGPRYRPALCGGEFAPLVGRTFSRSPEPFFVGQRASPIRHLVSPGSGSQAGASRRIRPGTEEVGTGEIWVAVRDPLRSGSRTQRVAPAFCGTGGARDEWKCHCPEGPSSGMSCCVSLTIHTSLVCSRGLPKYCSKSIRWRKSMPFPGSDPPLLPCRQRFVSKRMR